MLYRKLVNVWRNMERQSVTYGLPEPMSYGHEVEHKLAKWASYCDDLSQCAELAVRTFEPVQIPIYEEIIVLCLKNSPFVYSSMDRWEWGRHLIQTICDKI